jgi:glycosyltransferase involved in cell wall biosynthesis
MLRFLTVFPHTQNVHLIKDVGMLPFVLHKEFGYDSTIASYRNGEYPYLETEVKGLKQVFIKRIFKVSTLDTFIFIFFNFRKYDIVQCYHFDKRSLMILFLFKFLKKITFSNAFTYLKLDAVDDIKKTKLNFVYKILSKNINLMSAETKVLYDFINKNNLLARKVEYIPNGFYDGGVEESVDFESKENLIITVGRIGTYVKNNEILLEAFKDFALVNSEWKLEVIGPIEDNFQNYIQIYFELNPNLIDRVSFTGSITNREVLGCKYKKAKIFVLTSRNEGFPLVYLEAIKAGCTIISSAISSAYDITDNEKYGALFPVGDAKGLANELSKTISNTDKLSMDCIAIQQFAYEKYSWSKISIDVNNLIQKK